MASLRNKLSAAVLWGVFLALYVGGAVMLIIGVMLASRAWWSAVHLQASLWVISVKTAEVLVMAVGLLLILILPVFHCKSVGRSGAWRTGRRAETDGQVAVDKDNPLMRL